MVRARLRQLWTMVRNGFTAAGPHERALAVAAGVLVSAAPVPPVFGLRSATVLAVATLLRVNRILALAGAQLFFGPLWLAAVAAEVRLGSLLLGQPAPKLIGQLEADLHTAWGALGAWLLGAALAAPLVAAATYGVARLIGRRRAAPPPAPDA